MSRQSTWHSDSARLWSPIHRSMEGHWPPYISYRLSAKVLGLTTVSSPFYPLSFSFTKLDTISSQTDSLPLHSPVRLLHTTYWSIRVCGFSNSDNNMKQQIKSCHSSSSFDLRLRQGEDCLRMASKILVASCPDFLMMMRARWKRNNSAFRVLTDNVWVFRVPQGCDKVLSKRNYNKKTVQVRR